MQCYNVIMPTLTIPMPPPPKAAETISSYIAGEPVALLARRMGITQRTIYNWLDKYAPEFARKSILDDLDGIDLPTRILNDVRSKLDVLDAIQGVLIDLGRGETPHASQALVDYVLATPLDKLVDGMRGIDGSILRSAACLRRIKESMADDTIMIDAPTDAAYHDATPSSDQSPTDQSPDTPIDAIPIDSPTM